MVDRKVNHVASVVNTKPDSHHTRCVRDCVESYACHGQVSKKRQEYTGHIQERQGREMHGQEQQQGDEHRTNSDTTCKQGLLLDEMVTAHVNRKRDVIQGYVDIA